jgi:hypothetical protein
MQLVTGLAWKVVITQLVNELGAGFAGDLL